MSVFTPTPKKGNAKLCLNHCTIALISCASEVMLKILQTGLQQYMNQELPNEQLGLEKAEEADIQLPTSVGSSISKRVSVKHLLLLYIDYAKAFDCVDHNKLENSERDGNTRPPYLPPEKPVCR